ncbi:hypothetical protein HU200_060919 [Digitaria exilis]|uniref:Uncharacterized protein n=1 Tax=Digitaria exilis TaxID=1010633 RepID=A0A835A8K0_9POAL|nr:hypothetical protein HU200_060919 [Digitaria exilis]
MEAAVVSVSHGALGSLLGKRGELLTAKYKLLKEAKDHITFLKAELESMHAFMKKISDADEEPDEQDKCWAKEVRELSYDIEDSVSEFMLRVEHDSCQPHGIKGFISRSKKLVTTMKIKHEIAKEFEGLKIRVQEVSERRSRYKMDYPVSKANKTTVDTRLLALHAETASLVGITGPRDQLIQLMDEEGTPPHQLKVFSIVGFGGLGKTTLANEIYRKLEDKFDCQAFVPVSQKPNISKIMKKVLYKVGYVAHDNTTIEMWEESELITALKKFLLDKRCLLHSICIWDASAWDIIRCALPENNKDSRVITTTRNEAVARACCTNHIECVYKMKALSDLDSRSLFFKRIFDSEETCPPYLDEVSAEILKKCGGLPLAIITMSSVLANQPNKLKKEKWDFVRDSLRSNFEMSPTLEEDYEIDRNDLTKQWVAEGFVCKAHGRDPEDIAKSYFNELINRSMIQATDTDYSGEVNFCRVHDMMLDLILQKSREENFITVVDDIQDMAGHQDKIRRLSINLDGAINNTVARSVQLSQTRTLARYGPSWHWLPLKLFKHLRVLVFEFSGWNRSEPLLDITGICHLFQLVFLKIFARGFRLVLPSRIGDLQQLEVFDITAEIFSSKGIKSHILPSDIVTLSRLFHLRVPWDMILPEGIGNMKSLRSLYGFDLGNSLDNIKAPRELTNLTDLQIVKRHDYTSDEISREVFHALENLCNLKHLRFNRAHFDASVDEWSSVPVSFIYLHSLHVRFLFFGVPEWIGQLHRLYDLTLTFREVSEDDVGLLARLPSLTHLDLCIEGTPKHTIVIRGGSGLFPVLKHFKVSCSGIPHLNFESGAMPKVEKLKLNFNAQGWDRYGAAPAGVEHLSGLQEIHVNIGCRGVKESNKRAAESALRRVAAMHPGRPVANIKCFVNDRLVIDDGTDETKLEGDGGGSSS